MKWAGVDREVREAADQAFPAEPPEVYSIPVNIYSPDIDPTSQVFAAQPQQHGAPKTMSLIVAATLFDEMGRDARVAVFGEDDSRSATENLRELRAKAAFSKRPQGLQRKYGADRVFNLHWQKQRSWVEPLEWLPAG